MTEALDLLASLRLENGSRWGEVAVPWQWADAEAVLGLSGARLHYLTRPRGGSKTGDTAAMAAAMLLQQAPPGSRSYGFAVDQGQAWLLLDSLQGLTTRTPEVHRMLSIDRWKVTAKETGATFEIMASDAASAWGLRPYFVVVDEFSQWPTTPGPQRLWSAIFSALPKVPDSRLVILTSAGAPGHPAHKVLEMAHKSPRWRVRETPGPCPWISPSDLDEQRQVLPDWEFERLHMNHWTESEDRLTKIDDLRACVVLDGPRDPDPGRRYAMALDVGLKHDRTVVAICSLDESSRVVALDRMGVWQGSPRSPVSLDAVEAWISEALAAYGRPSLICDPYQAAQLMQRLRARSARVVEYPFTSQSVSRLALRLYQLIKDRALQLPNDEALLDELASVRLRETSPGVYRLDHDAGAHDDRAIALALAALHLLDRSPHRADPSVGLAVGALAGEMYRLNGFRMDQAGTGEVGWLR